jgi:thiamine-phosphate pyrophosphorylase
MALPALYAITDGERLGAERLLDVLARAAAGGLELIQVREKHLGGKDLAVLVRRLRDRLPSGVRLIVNGAVELAARLGLAGVHLGGDVHAVARARASLGPGFAIGYSAHRIEDLDLAASLGADYVSYSPVYRPSSKPSVLPPVGVDGLQRACTRARLPVFALGGVNASRVAELRRAGAAGVAAIGAILDAPDPAAAVRELIDAWRGAGRG